MINRWLVLVRRLFGMGKIALIPAFSRGEKEKVRQVREKRMPLVIENSGGEL
jgi:hypothetical protein